MNTNFEKALLNLGTTAEKFVKAVDDFKSFQGETMRDLGLELEAKQKQIGELEVDYKNKLKQAEIDLSLAMQEKGINLAKDVLTKAGLTVIEQSELDKLRDNLTKTSFERDRLVADTKKEVTDSLTKDYNNKLKQVELEHAAKLADLTAQGKQYDSQIKFLDAKLKEAYQELQNTRDLIAKVADSKAVTINQTTTGK
jgi:hypothetical protein